MKVLFLDFDGVLNSKQHILATKDKDAPGRNTLKGADFEFMKKNVNANNMWCLKYILDNVPDLQIVLSTSWRSHFEMDQFKELFKEFGLDESRLIGKTPKKFTSERIHEIHMWLDDTTEAEYDENGKAINRKVEVDWMAVDDHVIFNLEDPDKQRELLTDSWVGLTLPDAIKIIRHFKPDFKETVIIL